ncbi:MAG: RNA 2',3'-cyclic phosphodiesterase [Anaerolineae bacterium]
MSTYRTFIAIELPQHTRTALISLQHNLRREVGETVFRWVRPENFHLTLVFLGEVPAEQIPELAEALHAVAYEYSPFTLGVQGIGGFPNLKWPRVLWTGFNDSLGILTKLHKTLGPVLLSLGFPPEARPYTPHLTLAYAHKRAASREVKRAGMLLRRLQIDEVDQFGVSSISLMRSQLQPGGPVYTQLAQAPLVAVPER